MDRSDHTEKPFIELAEKAYCIYPNGASHIIAATKNTTRQTHFKISILFSFDNIPQ
tara:strand:- start:18882 stop:19049 length:168 start_codon:yes stop_codon:yes gene_type:complete